MSSRVKRTAGAPAVDSSSRLTVRATCLPWPVALAVVGLLAAGLAVAGPAGTGDFDADGRDEILLRERGSGGWGYHDVDDTGAVLHALETPSANGYEFLGVGDLNGDGYADVLLRHPGDLT